MKKFENIHTAYIGVLTDVRDDFDHLCAPRDKEIREIRDYMFRIEEPVAEPIITNDTKRNVVIERYTQAECDLYDSCSNKVEDFAKASSFWNQIQNPDGTINSAYGHLIWKNESFGNEFEGVMRTPWAWAKESLIADKDTRQAFIKFSLPEHHWFGNKDQTCTMHGNFLIREDALNLTIIMRSNDVVLGLAYDLPWFISLIDRMLEELKPTYPELKKGSYTHLSHSMHMYEKDIKKINKMIGDADTDQ